MKCYKKKLLLISGIIMISLIMFAGMCFLIVGKKGVVEFVDKSMNQEKNYAKNISKDVVKKRMHIDEKDKQQNLSKETSSSTIKSTDSPEKSVIEDEKVTSPPTKEISTTGAISQKNQETAIILSREENSIDAKGTASSVENNEQNTQDEKKDEKKDEKMQDGKPSVTVATSYGKNRISQSYTITASEGIIDISKLTLVYSSSIFSKEEYKMLSAYSALQYSVEPWYVNLTDYINGSFSDNNLTITINDSNNLSKGEGKAIVNVEFSKINGSECEEIKDGKLEVYYSDN